MDSFTQIVLGAAVGEAVLGKKVGNKAMLWGAIAGTIPDLDVLFKLFLDAVTSNELHRGFSHSLLFSLLISPPAGGLGALVTTWIWYGKPNLAQTLNGALAGLVSITAGCGNMTAGGAVLAGLIGGILVVFSIEFIEKKLKIDDAIGAASVHGVAGAWGTLVIGLWGVDGDTAIGLFNGGGSAQLGAQAIGVLAYAAWSVALSFIVLGILKATMGLRVSKEVEIEGLDISEHGSIAYPGKRMREIDEDK